MGDYAEQIINGDVCEQCGEYLGDGDGFPQLCSACQHEAPPVRLKVKGPAQMAPKPKCPTCGKKVKGLADHMRDAHGAEADRE